ncbi:MAG: CDP-diacylglycerol--serine O-phosphatidyltransferase [Bacteroidales bacterium]|nr:CDP-diacylglycerol--serine O-phosphatidyltransferase [Bacteroidales bacterium]
MGIIRQILRPLPNTLTLCNLVSGCLSVVSALEGRLLLASILVLVAAVFDFFDGFAARLLGASSALGKELDSLSDVVSFGVAPSIMLYVLMRQGLGLTPMEGIFQGHWLLVVPFFVAAMASLRLGRFNLDERQATSFIGLPTPAMAMVVVGLVMGQRSAMLEGMFAGLTHPYALVALCITLGLLMVCSLPMFSLKVSSLRPRVAYKQLLLLLGALPALLLGWAALWCIMGWYIALAIFFGIRDCWNT